MATARWRYALPNAITCISITAALLAISESVTGRFDSAAWFILLCVLLDKADGTMARLLHASSRFGIEMDSLSDLIAFGVAPAVLILSFCAGQAAGTPLATVPLYRALVYGGCFLYVIAAALRLAKFNVLTDVYGSEFFYGIPTTVCGALVASYFLTMRKYGLPTIFFEVIPGAMIGFAVLMVSRVPLPKLGRRKSLAMNIFTLANVVGVYIFGLLRRFPEYLLWCAVTYSVVGTGWALFKGIKPPKLDPEAEADAAESAPPSAAAPAEPTAAPTPDDAKP